MDEAKRQGIDVKYWNALQHGETVRDEETGRLFEPSMVMGKDRRGIKVTYTTDTRPCDNIVRAASGADLFICEGMYGEPGMEEKARAYRHMTMQESASMAARAEVPPRELWFTHYSPSMLRPKQYIEDIRKIFPNAVCGRDGMHKELMFDED